MFKYFSPHNRIKSSYISHPSEYSKGRCELWFCDSPVFVIVIVIVTLIIIITITMITFTGSPILYFWGFYRISLSNLCLSLSSQESSSSSSSSSSPWSHSQAVQSPIFEGSTAYLGAICVCNRHCHYKRHHHLHHHHHHTHHHHHRHHHHIHRQSNPLFLRVPPHILEQSGGGREQEDGCITNCITLRLSSERFYISLSASIFYTFFKDFPCFASQIWYTRSLGGPPGPDF